MLKSLRRLVGAIIFILTVSTFIPAAHAAPADVKGHWAEKEINRWIDRGILYGSSNNFKPEDRITRAEFVAIINRIIKYQDRSGNTYKDVKAGDWFAVDVDKAVVAGILKGDGNGKVRPKDNISRQEAAIIFSRVFGIEVQNRYSISGFSDASSIPSWSRDAICAMYENDYMTGRSASVYGAADKISRAESVKIIDNIINDLKNKQGTYTGDVQGNLVVNAAGVTLKGMTISGSLYLTQGIGGGSVILDNVTVKGSTIVNGGGDHSITVRNSSLKGRLVVYKNDGKIRIVAEGTTDIPSVLMQSGGTLEEKDILGKGYGSLQVAGVILPGQEISLDGDFLHVSVEAKGVDVNVTDGSVGSMAINDNAAGAKVNIGKNASVGSMTLNAAAGITGQGKISSVIINSNGVTMEQTPNAVSKKDGVVLPSNLQASQGTPAGGTAPVTGGGGTPAGDGGVPAGGGGGVPDGGGGGTPGGGGNTATLQVTSAYAALYNPFVANQNIQISAVKQGNEWVIDLRGKDEVMTFTDLVVSATSDVTEASVEFFIFNHPVNFSGGSATVNVKQMLGDLDTGDPGVSILSIKKVGMTTFSITLKNSSGGTSEVNIRLIV